MVPYTSPIEGTFVFFVVFWKILSLWPERMVLGLNARGMGSDPLWGIAMDGKAIDSKAVINQYRVDSWTFGCRDS